MSPQNNEPDWFLTKARIAERPFTSTTPLIGPFIAWLRTRWNNVSTRWYVLPILAQQNSYNQLVAERLSDMDNRLIALDREHTQLVHDVAELSVHFRQMNQLLHAINARLAHLEEETKNNA